VEIVGCPTVREADGLAMSSRNAYLAPAERQAATVLHRALQAARARFSGGVSSAEALRAEMRRVLEAEALARIDYVSCADPDSLAELEEARAGALLSMAVFFGKTRLIDNLALE
jgi:pantoate--beta-alanine ligase